MIGLPSSTLEDEIKTARFIASSGASEARIYPTVVFRDTELCQSTILGEYMPLSVEDAVSRSAEVFKIFVDSGIKVLRIGLCDSENLHSEETYFAGPNEAALGELVINRYYLNLIKERLGDLTIENNPMLSIYVPCGHVSKVIGQHKKNKNHLLKEYAFSGINVIESDEVKEYDVFLRIEERK